MIGARCLGAALLCLTALQGQERFAGSAHLDRLIEEAITEGRIPGAVLWVGQPGKILHRKAYGARALEPQKEPMTLDTIFDAASLTKVIATTSAVMKLFEQGKVRLGDKVTDYLRDFQGGKSGITVSHLLTHFSGLRPDVDLKPEWAGYETGIRLAFSDKPVAEPGERFIYSDINFVVLGELVGRLSGRRLDVYSREEIFGPLGMKETMFNPPAGWAPRIAPTERVKGKVLRGVVHDPTSRFMGGVAGHAGLFTTAADLSLWCEMMLRLGTGGRSRLYSPLTVRKFTAPASPAGQQVLRGLGVDIDSQFSGNRGELFPIGSYGHTGFTGTSVWIDPQTQTYVILLTNSVHPRLQGNITSLRGRVATVVAAALGVDRQDVLLTGYGETGAGTRWPVNRTGSVLTGLDVLAKTGYAPLRGRRVGLITNHTGLTREGRRNIDAFLAAGIKLTALFSPEHGIEGKQDTENVAHSTDETSGLPVYSLYRGPDRKPGAEMLGGVDVLVFDMQDVGARFYTYLSTMKNAMEAAAEAGKEFIVLDRPNPITGIAVEGPMIDADLISFVGAIEIPVRHGMTLGELARMIQAESGLKLKLTVIAMEGWRRGDWWDSTGLAWVNPSPNMRSLNAAVLYPGVALLEYAKNWSVGRGTDAPFEQAGADWLDARAVAAHLNRRAIPGVRVHVTEFEPAASVFAGKRIRGLRFVVIDRHRFSSVRFGLELAAALHRIHPGKIGFEENLRLIGSRAAVAAIVRGDDPRQIESSFAEPLRSFAERRKRYLLYR